MKKLLGIGIAGLLSCMTLPALSQDNSSSNETNTGGTTASQPVQPPEPKSLEIASWGGAYMQAQNNAYFKPFGKNSDLTLNTQVHSGKYEEIKTRLSSSPSWDVIDLPYSMVEKACSNGLIEPINHNSLDSAPDGSAVEEDFFKDGLHKCGVASQVWSLLIVYNKDAFRKRIKPKTVSDFFNPRRYRGKRVLPRTAENVLELALLASKVKPEDVYSTLETQKGIDLAFRTLDRIKKQIIWSSKPSEAFQLLADGKASFGIGYNGRAFSVIAEQKKPLKIIWDGQIYHYNLWAIPKNAKNKNTAREFITFATNPRRLAVQSSWFPYGPTRRSAIQLIKLHPEADIDLKPYIPTVPRNFKLALRKNDKWWDKHRTILQARFERWARGEKEPRLLPDIAINTQESLTSDQPIIEEKETETDDEKKDG